MIIGYLAISIFVAFVSGIWALVSGLGLLAIMGFYVLGGTLAIAGTACAVLFTRTAQHSGLIAAKI